MQNLIHIGEMHPSTNEQVSWDESGDSTGIHSTHASSVKIQTGALEAIEKLYLYPLIHGEIW